MSEPKKIRISDKNPYIADVIKRLEENPIVERLEDDPKPDITKIEHIKELQEILVQTCIDYINKNGLTDIYQVSFSADDLAESAKYGSWQACTDSNITVYGLGYENHRRKNGEIFKMATRYKIGEYM